MGSLAMRMVERGGRVGRGWRAVEALEVLERREVLAGDVVGTFVGPRAESTVGAVIVPAATNPNRDVASAAVGAGAKSAVRLVQPGPDAPKADPVRTAEKPRDDAGALFGGRAGVVFAFAIPEGTEVSIVINPKIKTSMYPYTMPYGVPAYGDGTTFLAFATPGHFTLDIWTAAFARGEGGPTVVIQFRT